MCSIRRSLILSLAVVTLFLVASLSSVSAQHSSSEAPSGEEFQPINQTCPVTPEESVDPRFTTVYQGQLVGFCCRRCLTKFNASPGAYLANLPEGGTGPALQHANDASAEHTHDDGQAHDLMPVDDGHDHDHSQRDTRASRLVAWLGNFHPPATDLPIGMLLGAVLAEILFILTKRERFRHAATFCVWLAAAGATAAATLGWFNGGFALADADWVQTTHRWLGTSTALLTLLTLGLLIRTGRSDQARQRVVFRVALFLAAGLVATTGFFGGALVYGLGHYAW